jgi:hypothetical protein
MAIAAPQTYLKVKDFTVDNTIGIPTDGVGWVSVENLGCNFPPHNASSTESRCGGEQHKIYDYSQCIWNDITFNCHATPDAQQTIYDLFNSFAQGDNLRGSVTVNFVNVKDAYSTIFSFEFQELTLLQFNPGMVADVDHPGTLQWSFTISANYVKIS